MNKIPISLILILKNEAKTISDTISSAASIVDNVICGIDDTTDDNTEAIVKSKCIEYNLDLQIEQFEFKDDFAALRNTFIEKSTTEWVLILDGHEYIKQSCLHIFHDLLNNGIVDKNDIFDFTISDQNLTGGEVLFQQPRLFRKSIKYTSAVHNVILQADRRISFPQINIVHNQPPERLAARKEQRKHMNTKNLLKLAHKGDVRAMYYLGNTYYEMNDYQNAERWYKRYLNKSDFDEERYMARINLAYIYDSKKDYDMMKETLIACFDDKVSFNEHLIMLGDIYAKKKEYNTAKYFYRLATSVKIPDRFMLISKDAYTWLPWHRLAIAGLATNDLELVREAIDKGKQYAPDRPEFFDIEEKVNKKIGDSIKKKEGTIYVIASIPSFIKPLLHNFTQNYHVMFEGQFNPREAEKANVIFCEWADHNAIAVSNFKTDAKKVLRIHSYEVFSDYMNKINFDAFDKIIFVAEHIRKYWFDNYGHKTNRTKVIANGVNLDKFTIAESKTKNNKIAYAGFISNKKGAPLLMSAAYHLPEYEFHIAGQFQGKDVEHFFNLTKPSNMFIYPWQDDLNEFFKDKTYIINTSLREGCPVAMLEGMASGLKPLSFKFDGVDQIFGNYNYWVSADMLKLLLKDEFKPESCRQMIIDKYDEKDQLKKINDLISNLIKEKHDG